MNEVPDFNLLIEEMIAEQTRDLPRENLPALAEAWDRLATASEAEAAYALASDFKMAPAVTEAFLALGAEWRQQVCRKVAAICRDIKSDPSTR